MRLVITGANRGIGLELVRQYLAAGAIVDAGVRDPARAEALRSLEREHPGKLSIRKCDVSSEPSIRGFAKEIRGGVDLLINNAGVMGEAGGDGLSALHPESLARTFITNAVAPLLVSRELLPQLREGKDRKIVHVSSKMGSIDDNGSGGAYGYRMSKAALNMGARSLSVDLRPEGILSVVLHPGWVRTDMGGKSAPVEVHESVLGMVGVIAKLTLAQTGQFFDFQGATIPW